MLAFFVSYISTRRQTPVYPKGEAEVGWGIAVPGAIKWNYTHLHTTASENEVLRCSLR